MLYEIKQITSVDDSFILNFNHQLDEGKVWDIEQGAKYLSNSDNVLFCAYVGETIVGFLSAYKLQRFDKRKAEVLLYEIGVDEKYRQKGIGKALIQSVKKWAQEREADEVWVLTNKSNIAATSLYKSEGGTVESLDEVMYTFKL